jgi:hypothetical protein
MLSLFSSYLQSAAASEILPDFAPQHKNGEWRFPLWPLLAA